MNRLLLVATFFAIAGCATPGPEPGQTESLQTLESASGDLPDSNRSASVQTAQAAVGESNAPESPVDSFDGIEDIEAPTVSESSVAMPPPQRLAEQEVVCTREARTGSILKTKVCRRRSDIEREREIGQESMRRVKTEIAVGTSRPGTSRRRTVPNQF